MEALRDSHLLADAYDAKTGARPWDESIMNAHETAQMCYRMAYFLLPQYVQQDPEKVASELTSGRIGAMFFFVMTCQIGGQEPKEEDAPTIQAFRAHAGRLNDDWDYYIVEYPPPA